MSTIGFRVEAAKTEMCMIHGEVKASVTLTIETPFEYLLVWTMCGNCAANLVDSIQRNRPRT